MGIRPFGMRFQKFDQFRNSDILHITKVSFSEDVGGGAFNFIVHYVGF
jgi:hypothetical protein